MLFIDARGTYRQVSRAIRDFLPEQIEFLANIVRLWRGEAVEIEAGSPEMLRQQFPGGGLSGHRWGVQGGDAGGDRGAGVESESGAVCGGF